jgi:hypothetical protein
MSVSRLAANEAPAESAGRPKLAIALTTLVATLALISALAATARADVGVTRVSPPVATPGDWVVLTLGCGFCYPPCVGPAGHSHPAGYDHGACMLDTGRKPPGAFPISLVPSAKAPSPHPCRGGLCPGEAPDPPDGGAYRFLGRATPPPGGNDPASGLIPRYLLGFRVPAVGAGRYTFVIFCAACNRGSGGSLVASGELRVRTRAAATSMRP